MSEKIKVIITNEQDDFKIPTGIRMLIRRSCNAVLMYKGIHKSATINVFLTDNKKCAEQKPKVVTPLQPKEVITSETDDDTLGNIYISIEKVMELAKVYDESFQMGMVFSTIHGMLNLLGDFYETKAKKIEQMEVEAEIMKRLGFSPLSYL